MWKWIKHRWVAQGDLARLQGINDRLLRDMGLERENLRGRVMGRDIEQSRRRLPLPVAHLARS